MLSAWLRRRPQGLVAAFKRRRAAGFRPWVEILEDRTAPAIAASLAAAPTTVTFGQPFTLTATLTNDTGGVLPAGDVLFREGNTTLGDVPVPGGSHSGFQAVLSTVPALTVGTHDLIAVYQGTTFIQNPTGQAGPEVLAKSNDLTEAVKPASAVTRAASRTSIVPPAATVFGQPATFTATVTGDGKVAPTGTVLFQEGSSVLGAGVLDGNGRTVFTTAALAAGTHQVAATYQGDDNFAASTADPPASLTVSPASTTLTLTVSANSVLAGEPVELFIQVAAPGAGTPTGAVAVRDAGAVLATVPLVNGSAVWSTMLAPGPHSLTAAYTGDADFTASDSAALPVTVTQAPPGTTNHQRLERLFQDLLGRKPTSVELKKDSALPLTALVLTIEASREYHSRQARLLYRSLLHRDPTQKELDTAARRLATGTLEELESILLGSSDYFERRAGGSDEGWLAAVVNDVLHRRLAPGDMPLLNSLNSGMTREQVAGVLLDSTEAKTVRLDAWFLQYLHRLPTLLEMQTFGPLEQQGVSDNEQLAVLLDSPDYAGP